MIWGYLAVFVASLLVTVATRPKYNPPTQTSNQKPGQLTYPTAEDGKEIPVLFGTRYLSGSNVVWVADIKTMPRKQGEVTLGYFYFMSCMFSVCVGPARRFWGIKFDNKICPYNVRVDNHEHFNEIQLAGPEMFGGADGQGGVGGEMQAPSRIVRWIETQTHSYAGKADNEVAKTIRTPVYEPGEKRSVGDVTIMWGKRDQPRYGWLGNKGTELYNDQRRMPAYKGVCSFLFKDVYFGNAPQLRAPSFKVTRIDPDRMPAGWSTNLTTYQHAEAWGMNPADIIMECLTNNEWGMGYPVDSIDTVSFGGAQGKLYQENMFLCIVWDKSSSINDFIKRVLDHINGNLYISRETGKFHLMLIRHSQTLIDNAIVANEDNIVSISNFKRSLESELTSKVIVKYWDVDNNKERTVTVSDTALASRQSGVISVTRDYTGLFQESQARQVAMRDLKALSSPVVTCTVKVDRSFFDCYIGQYVKLHWLPYGIDNMVMRISAIDIGSLDDETITLQLVEDVFGLTQSKFVAQNYD